MDKIHQKSIYSNERLTSNWGQYPQIKACIFEPKRPSSLMPLLSGTTKIIARGNGRCYGDSSLQKHIISTRCFNRFLDFDREKKTLYCESGILLGEILQLIVSAGCFLPVVPGTRFITIGGAVASNIHGKNHHRAGSIAKYIRFLNLIGENGKEIRCSPTENATIFAATIGGMGLTGVITSISIQLIPLETAYIEQQGQACSNLQELCAQLIKSDKKYSYTVAWMDGTSQVGRGVLLSGENCELRSLPPKFKHNPLAVHSDKTLKIPPLPSSQLLNRWVLSAYNNWFYHLNPTNRKKSIIHYSAFFFPLDKLEKWNRLYGPKGMLQYQFVLPMETSAKGLAHIWERIQASSCRPFLVVLKAFHHDPTPVSPYSFPMPGLSLAMDFKNNIATLKLLDELDQLVITYLGRLYLTKDARMQAKIFKVTYPNVQLPRGNYQSLQSQRLQNLS